MLVLGVVLGLTGLVVVTAVMLALRTVVLDEEKVEKQLREPGAHTLEFEVPNGLDPAVLRAALAHEHFTSVTRFDGGAERMMIACEEQDRVRVRSVLEHVHAASAAGPDQYLGHVQFSDEDADTSTSRTLDDGQRAATATEPFAHEVDAHRKHYLISMGIRTLCFVVAVLSIGHWFVWLFLLAALVLPYFAVIAAN